jgi:hypothetical protein
MRYVTYDESGFLTGAFMQELHPSHADAYIEVDADTYARWPEFRIVNGALEAVPHQEPAEDWPALIASRRYDAETAGIELMGMHIDTGRDSQALITGAALAAMRDPAYVCRWKTAGGFVELNAEQLTAVADTVRAHVQACFDREADLLAALEAGTFTESMLEEGWPNEPLPESAPS